MVMDIKYLIIGGVLVILLVAFGNNPAENSRKERAEAKKGKDPLMLSIQEYNEKNPRERRASREPEVDSRTRRAIENESYRAPYQGSPIPGSDTIARETPPPSFNPRQADPAMPSYMYPSGRQPLPSVSVPTARPPANATPPASATVANPASPPANASQGYSGAAAPTAGRGAGYYPTAPGERRY